MAKALGPKSLLIRDAIKAHPHMGNTELAELINGSDARSEDRIEVKANDIAQQKQAMKKGGESAPAPAPAAEKPARKKPGRKPGQTAVTAAPSPARKPAAASAPARGVAGHVEAIKKAVDELGADQVRKLTGLFE